MKSAKPIINSDIDNVLHDAYPKPEEQFNLPSISDTRNKDQHYNTAKGSFKFGNIKFKTYDCTKALVTPCNELKSTHKPKKLLSEIKQMSKIYIKFNEIQPKRRHKQCVSISVSKQSPRVYHNSMYQNKNGVKYWSKNNDFSIYYSTNTRKIAQVIKAIPLYMFNEESFPNRSWK
jgi:hypothetical protein